MEDNQIGFLHFHFTVSITLVILLHHYQRVDNTWQPP